MADLGDFKPNPNVTTVDDGDANDPPWSMCMR